jgi:hypothetical protein
MFKTKKISLVIPCYNEEEGLRSIFQKIPSFIDEVVVADNNSTDKTSEIAKQFGAVVVFEKKRGYGLAYRKGLLNATGDIIVTMDGDGSYPVGAAESMIAFLEEKAYDFVNGNRFPVKDRTIMPFINQIANLAISSFIRYFFKVNIVDSQAGMWAFRRNVLPEIISHNPGMGFSQEIKLNAWLNPRITCGEFHINYQNRFGQVKFRRNVDSLKNLYELVIFFMRIKKKYL